VWVSRPGPGSGSGIHGEGNEKWFDLRAFLNRYNLSKAFTKSDIDYDGNSSSRQWSARDFHPFRNRIRLTGGSQQPQ